MKQFLHIVFLLLSVQTFGQSYYEIYQKNTRKATVTYPGYKATVPLMPVKKEIEVENDKFYYWFSGNKINVTQGGFSGKLLHGRYTEYFLTGNLREQGEFKKGLKAGEWRTWTNAGVLAEQVHWRDGGKSGTYYKYDSVGRVIEKGKLRNNILDGKLSRYSGKDIVVVTRYRHGSVVNKKTPGYIKFIMKRLAFKNKKKTANDTLKIKKPVKEKKQKKEKSK